MRRARWREDEKERSVGIEMLYSERHGWLKMRMGGMNSDGEAQRRTRELFNDMMGSRFSVCTAR